MKGSEYKHLKCNAFQSNEEREKGSYQKKESFSRPEGIDKGNKLELDYGPLEFEPWFEFELASLQFGLPKTQKMN
nr:hypothetical protein Iba_chr12fCG16280 [Ipomoea batatas]